MAAEFCFKYLIFIVIFPGYLPSPRPSGAARAIQ